MLFLNTAFLNLNLVILKIINLKLQICTENNVNFLYQPLLQDINIKIYLHVIKPKKVVPLEVRKRLTSSQRAVSVGVAQDKTSLAAICRRDVIAATAANTINFLHVLMYKSYINDSNVRASYGSDTLWNVP